MKNQIEESNLSEAATAPTQSTKAATLRKRTKALLGVTALLGAAMVSNLSRADQVNAEVRTVSAGPELDVILAPARGTKVYVQGNYRYHWHKDCPLTSAKSLRAEGEKPSVRRVQMDLGQAEKKNMHPCLYCAEVQG